MQMYSEKKKKKKKNIKMDGYDCVAIFKNKTPFSMRIHSHRSSHNQSLYKKKKMCVNRDIAMTGY